MKRGILLDTHTVIWYLIDPDKLSPAATAAIDSGAVFPVSWFQRIWELTFKKGLYSNNNFVNVCPLLNAIALLSD